MLLQEQTRENSLEVTPSHSAFEGAAGTTAEDHITSSVAIEDLNIKTALSGTEYGLAHPSRRILEWPDQIRSGRFTVADAGAMAGAGVPIRTVDSDPRFLENKRILGRLANPAAVEAPWERGVDIKSQRYESLLESNPGFRQSRIRKECGPITDPELRQQCLTSFYQGEGSRIPAKRQMVYEKGDWVPADTSPKVAALQPTAAPNYADPRERVHGGVPVTLPDPFPDAVAVIGKGGVCSGVLIKPDLVLTAAHCYCKGMSEVIFGISIVYPPPERIEIDDHGSEPLTPCTQILTNLSLGDVALLRLKKPVKFPYHPISDLTTITDQRSVRAVGFGTTSEGYVGIKYQVNIIVATPRCNGIYRQLNLPDTQGGLCTTVRWS
jgi:hypothetical protein